MPNPCTVCQHPEREAVDHHLVNGRSNRAVARQYDLGREAIRNHRTRHVPETLTKARRAQEEAHADDLLDQVRQLRDRALGILERAEAADDHKVALAAIREARATVELLAKLVGELDERPVVNIANLFCSTEWLRVQALVIDVLQPHPEARERLVTGLTAIEERTHGNA